MHTAEKTLREHIKAGRGQGHGAGYQPWLQISRRKTPSNSNINFRHLPMLGRHGHFLSRNEVNIAIWLLWLGANDLREQFPLWPFAHPHPLYGLPALSELTMPWSRGTLAIAADLGIDHGWIAGTRLPYVATTDFMLTVLADGIPTAVAVAAKPSAIVEGRIAAKQRIKERLALEMAYARELGIPWQLISDGGLPIPLRENLELIFPCSCLPAPSTLIEEFCDHLAANLRDGWSVDEACRHATRRCRKTEQTGRALFYHGLWTRQIPIDLRHRIVLTQPAHLTDFSWAEADAQRILKGGRRG